MIFAPDLPPASCDRHRPIGVLLLMANMLDCEAIGALLAPHKQIRIVGAIEDAEQGFAYCLQKNPFLLVIDPKVARDAVSRTGELVAANVIRHAIILDDRVHDARVALILKLRRISYLTRATTGRLLVDTIERLGRGGRRSFDLAVADRIIPSPRGARLRILASSPSVAALSKREQEVLELLATGFSVRECAEKLHLAASTVDNHKTSLMKKLEVHKSTQLVHLAIRDGLVTV